MALPPKMPPGCQKGHKNALASLRQQGWHSWPFSRQWMGLSARGFYFYQPGKGFRNKSHTHRKFPAKVWHRSLRFWVNNMVLLTYFRDSERLHGRSVVHIWTLQTAVRNSVRKGRQLETPHNWFLFILTAAAFDSAIVWGGQCLGNREQVYWRGRSAFRDIVKLTMLIDLAVCGLERCKLCWLVFRSKWLCPIGNRCVMN